MKNKFFGCQINGEKAINAEKGTIEFVLTSKTVDRDSEVVLPKGVDITNFRKNPVFLWAHDRTLPPIGKVLVNTINKTEQQMTATVEFDLKDPFSALIFSKYQNGYLNAGSIGFKPKKIAAPILDQQRGVTYEEIELLEFSGVPIPSNPEANQLAFGKSLDGISGKEMLPLANYMNEYASVSERGMNVDSWLEWCEIKDLINHQAIQEVDSEDKSILNRLVSTIENSYQWIDEQLKSLAPDFLIEHNSIANYRPDKDEIVVAATFQKEVVLCLVGWDRPFSDDICVRAKWGMKDGKPVLKGTPEAVEITLEVRRRTYSKNGIEKEIGVIVPELTYDEAAARMIELMEGAIVIEDENERKRFYDNLVVIYTKHGKTPPQYIRLKDEQSLEDGKVEADFMSNDFMQRVTEVLQQT